MHACMEETPLSPHPRGFWIPRAGQSAGGLGKYPSYRPASIMESRRDHILQLEMPIMYNSLRCLEVNPYLRPRTPA